ncbi:MAG: primosomal protein N' [Propioniciclava sp.]
MVGRVAKVAVDIPLPHLDRLFDYRIQPDQSVEPGMRVRVRFAGRLRDGYVLEVVEGDLKELAPIERVVSAESVLTPATARLIRRVADHWGGTFADVVRLAIPPRHAATEKAQPPERPRPHPGEVSGVWQPFSGAERFLIGLREGEPLRAAWNPVPVWGDAWLAGVLDAVAATLHSGRGAIVVVPDGTTLRAMDRACVERFGAGSFATLSAEAGPSVRYRNFIAVARGQVSLVIGTRAAVYAPVSDLGLVAVWDEGNDLLSEPRAPYPHAREVAALRASLESSGLLLAGFGRSAEVQAWVERSWVVPLTLSAREVRRWGPAVRVAADTDWSLDRDPHARAARLPHDVFESLRTGLTSGPVLLQVPRAGYAPRLACEQCRCLARCPTCAHPVRGESGSTIVCPTCGPISGWRCAACGSARLRAPRVGVTRTAEELGRAFPHARVVTSWSGHQVRAIDAEPALVLATPGAEPRPANGYAAAVLLDTSVLLGRADLRAAEEALRRWLGVCALVRSADAGGTVMVVGEAQTRAIQALVRLDVAGFATRELAERAETHFPPAATLVTVDGPLDALADFARSADQIPTLESFGPSPLGEQLARLTLRVTTAHGPALVQALKEEMAGRSSRKSPGPLRLRVDPLTL